MTAIYSITLDDYLKANRTFALHTTRKRRVSAFLLRWIFLPLGLLLVLEGAILAYIKEYSLAWMLAVFGVIFALWPWGHRRTLRRLYTQQQLDREFEFSVEDRGIRWQRVDKSVNSTYDWTAIKQIIESSIEFLFLLTDIQTLILPKRVLNSQQQEELRNVLRKHAPSFRQVN